jgi:S1-C subfamily serine protease
MAESCCERKARVHSVNGKWSRGVIAGLFIFGAGLGGSGSAAYGQKAERQAARDEQGGTARLAEDVAFLNRVSTALSRVAATARPSVVSVQTVISNSGGHQQRASGSGVVFDARGYIVTSAHVLEGSRQVEVMLSDGRRLPGQIVGEDPKTDVAVLRVNASNLTPAKFADSSCVEVGNLVLAIGSPFRLSQTVSHGIVSATGRTNLDIEGMEYQNFIQTDAPTNPGNSGGALVNTRGEVIGINTAIAGSGNFSGVAFATPSNTVAWAARHIISGKPLVRGYMGIGITPVYPEVAERVGLGSAQGAYIEQVTPDGPAARAGLRTEDVVLQLNGAKVCESGQLQTLIAEQTPGARATLTIWRDRQRRKVDIVVGEQPQNLSER